MKRNVLPDVPSELLDALRADLPPASKCGPHYHVIIKLPDGTRARVTFTRSRSLRRQFRERWFWTAETAELIDK